MFNDSPPIIILGMHRSGTTLIASMLRDLGLNIGNDLEENKESMKFLKFNDWILHQSGASWDNPLPVNYLLSSKIQSDFVCDYLKIKSKYLNMLSFAAVKKRFSQFVLGRNSPQLWGWKDPRTVFTLPIWSKVYPNAKIIYVYRNGVDVAASLRARELKLLNNARNLHQRRKTYGAYSLFNKRGGFGWSPRCMELDGAFALWEEYVIEAEKNIRDANLDCLEIRYEDFLFEPADGLESIAKFCGLSTHSDTISKVAAACDPERAGAFETDTELVEFYNTVKDRHWMAKLGYSDNLNLGLS